MSVQNSLTLHFFLCFFVFLAYRYCLAEHSDGATIEGESTDKDAFAALNIALKLQAVSVCDCTMHDVLVTLRLKWPPIHFPNDT